MFTGIIEYLWMVEAISPDSLTVRIENDPSDWEIGESVAVNGCCLTVVSFDKVLKFDVSPETWSRTSFRHLAPGSRVNVERAMRASDRFGGHVVQGHVDATGTLVGTEVQGEYQVFSFQAPPEYDRYLIDKGSIAVEGISLTVVTPSNGRFDVALIPHTLEVTNLRGLLIGDIVNLEFDVMAKHIEKLMAASAKAK